MTGVGAGNAVERARSLAERGLWSDADAAVAEARTALAAPAVTAPAIAAPTVSAPAITAPTVSAPAIAVAELGQTATEAGDAVAGAGTSLAAEGAVDWGLSAVAVLVEFNTLAGTAEFDRLTELLREPRARNLLGERHAAALAAIGVVQGRSGDVDAGAVSLARAVQLMPVGTPGRTAAQAELVLLRLRQGQWRQAWEVLAAIDPERLGDRPVEFATARAAQVLRPAFDLDLERAVTELRQASVLVDAAWSPLADALLLHARFAVLLGLEDWRDLLAAAAAARESGYRPVPSEHELRALEGTALWNLGGSGRGTAGPAPVARFRRLVETWRAVPGAETSPYYWLHRALVDDLERDHAAMAGHLAQAGELLTGAEDPLGRTLVRMSSGNLITRRISPAEGMAHWETAREEMRQIGASGFVELCTRVLARTREEVAAAGGNPLNTLTAQQRRVVDLIGGGYTSAEIAQLLHLSRKTVDFHAGNALARLGLTRRNQIRRLLDRYAQPGE